MLVLHRAETSNTPAILQNRKVNALAEAAMMFHSLFREILGLRATVSPVQ
ncbi:MAG: hypothetical protein K2Q15_00430 [Burkholderiales bacterium]|jgi:hypothetical protein|nr:hypothetical protein [Burkholderiales bacterium]